MNDIIVGMGEALWDVLPEGKKIGGAPANFAYHVSQFGFDSRVVSAVGEDKLGNEILKNFDAKKLNYLIEKVPYPTGTRFSLPGREIEVLFIDHERLAFTHMSLEYVHGNLRQINRYRSSLYGVFH